MARWQWLGIVAAAGMVSAAPSLTLAQGYGGVVQQPQQQKQELHGKGEFEAVAAGGVFKAVLDAQPWLLKLDQKPKVSVTGSATVDALVPGMFVKFKGEFDKKGKASAEINDLEVFTPNEKQPIGATPAGASGFDAPMPAKKGPPPTTPTTYDIAGRITSIKKNTITVSCGNMTVHGDLASDATVTLNVADLSLASSGDKIEVRGWYVKGQEGRGYASDVQVTLSNQFTGPKKRGAHPVKTTNDKSADKAGAADAAGAGDAKPDKTKKPDPKSGAAKTTDATKKPAADKTDDAKPDTAADKTDAGK